MKSIRPITAMGFAISIMALMFAMGGSRVALIVGLIGMALSLYSLATAE